MHTTVHTTAHTAVHTKVHTTVHSIVHTTVYSDVLATVHATMLSKVHTRVHHSVLTVRARSCTTARQVQCRAHRAWGGDQVVGGRQGESRSVGKSRSRLVVAPWCCWGTCSASLRATSTLPAQPPSCTAMCSYKYLSWNLYIGRASKYMLFITQGFKEL